jgi:heat shock protein HslJ
MKADCNQVTGTYTVDGSSLTLSTLGPSTLAACPEGSLDQEYLAALNTVSSFGMQADQLVLVLKENAGKMTFANGGPAAAPAPEVCAGINFASVTLEAQELPYTWQKNCVVATPYDSSMPPTPVGLPEHIQINFIPAGAQSAQPEDPIIYLIPVDSYRELWDENGNQAVSTSLEQLRTLLKDQPSPLPPSSLPVLPYEEVGGVNDLAVQGEYLEDENFTGLRFVGRFSQGPNPVTNQGLMYIYQGGTYDAEYFIALFYPVSTSELPNSAADVPAEEMQQVDSNPTTYLAEKGSQLNALQPEDWEPDLTVLDTVIGSLQFKKVSQEEAASSTTVPLITGQLWKWIEVVETQPAAQTIVPDPDKYTLILNPDGRFDLLADCNSGSGSYVMEGDSLDLTVETMTMAFCGPESLSDSFVTLLGEVKTYALDGDQLKLITAEGGEEMLFSTADPWWASPHRRKGFLLQWRLNRSIFAADRVPNIPATARRRSARAAR